MQDQLYGIYGLVQRFLSGVLPLPFQGPAAAAAATSARLLPAGAAAPGGAAARAVLHVHQR